MKTLCKHFYNVNSKLEISGGYCVCFLNYTVASAEQSRCSVNNEEWMNSWLETKCIGWLRESLFMFLDFSYSNFVGKGRLLQLWCNGTLWWRQQNIQIHLVLLQSTDTGLLCGFFCTLKVCYIPTSTNLSVPFFSNTICLFCVFVPHFGDSLNISIIFLIFIFLTVTYDQWSF